MWNPSLQNEKGVQCRKALFFAEIQLVCWQVQQGVASLRRTFDERCKLIKITSSRTSEASSVYSDSTRSLPESEFSNKRSYKQIYEDRTKLWLYGRCPKKHYMLPLGEEGKRYRDTVKSKVDNRCLYAKSLSRKARREDQTPETLAERLPGDELKLRAIAAMMEMRRDRDTRDEAEEVLHERKQEDDMINEVIETLEREALDRELQVGEDNIEMKQERERKLRDAVYKLEKLERKLRTKHWTRQEDNHDEQSVNEKLSVQKYRPNASKPMSAQRYAGKETRPERKLHKKENREGESTVGIGVVVIESQPACQASPFQLVERAGTSTGQGTTLGGEVTNQNKNQPRGRVEPTRIIDAEMELILERRPRRAELQHRVELLGGGRKSARRGAAARVWYALPGSEGAFFSTLLCILLLVLLPMYLVASLITITHEDHKNCGFLTWIDGLPPF